jgi:hypothetical protein
MGGRKGRKGLGGRYAMRGPPLAWIRRGLRESSRKSIEDVCALCVEVHCSRTVMRSDAFSQQVYNAAIALSGHTPSVDSYDLALCGSILDVAEPSNERLANRQELFI